MNLKFRIVPNAMPASQGEAKYLGIIIPNGVRNRALMVKNIIAREHFSESTVNAVLDAAIAETEALCAEGRDVSWGPVKFISKMHGSFPYEDSAFEDGTASVTVDAEGSGALRALFADVVPTPMSAAELASAIKVSNVTDVATMSIGEIHGTDEFIITGNSVTLDAEGESAKLVDRKSGETLATAEVTTVSKGQRATCKLPEVMGGIAPGQYWLVVTTFGLVGETTPRVFRKPVTLTEAVPAPEPEFTSATSEGCREGYVMPNSKVTVTGVGLRVPTADESFFVDMPEGKGRANFTTVSVSADGTTLTAHVGDWPEGAVPGDGYVVWLDAEGATITVCEVEVGT